LRLVVTGVSGKLARLVVKELLRRVAATELILVSRSPDALKPFVDAGAAVRYGDFEQPETLPAAFAGGDRALIVSVLARDPVAAHRAAFQAAARSGVAHIVYTSVLNPVVENPFPPATVHHRSEHDLRAIGVPWTVLRNALYADLRVEIADAYLRDRRWTTNIGHGMHAFVARSDCARAAAAALAAEVPAVRSYHLTGPELVDASRYVAAVEEYGGHRIEVHEVDDAGYEEYRSRFFADPANAAYFELFGGTGTAIRTGHLNQLGTGVLDLTGRMPLSVRELFRRRGTPPGS
jgi:NAD(P)H dehydrogenase (quinone)